MTPNDKLPEAVYSQVLTDAKAYADKRILQAAYYDGATAWAPWKVKHDELQATIDDKIDIALHAERNKMQAMVTASEVAWAKEYHDLKTVLQEFVSNHEAGLLPNRFVYEKAINILNDKDGGKEVDKVYRPCPHCGKELFRDRNLCCRACGKEVGDEL